MQTAAETGKQKHPFNTKKNILQDKTGDFDLRSFFICSKKDLAMKRRMYVEDD